MLYGIVVSLHVLVSLLLIGVVLMQSGRGGGLAGAFGGGGGNQTLFGGRGATTFLAKATWVLGGTFMVTSLVLALAIGRRSTTTTERSVLRDTPMESPAATAPSVPGQPPAEGTEQPAQEPSGP